MHFYKPVLLALLFILSAGKLSASHYFGVDMFYTHVSGNTYRLTIVAFGDCSGAQFPSFPTTRPRVYVKRGGTTIYTAYLDQEAPKAGIEVTEGCPTDLKRTTCVDAFGTVPGVKKFIYSREFVLPIQASDWNFVYLGETDDVPVAGRSNSLTNVSPPGIISLEATLDNTKQHNSSPRFNTVATQFYCINSPVSYNPGVVDADGDSLVFELVSGLDGTSVVKYVSGYSGSSPLAAIQGTFSFNSSTGQLGFTPNLLQKSLVVYRVSEYRNGVLIGTVMREMTMVVLTCINYPPMGNISGASGAQIINDTTVQTCIGNHEVAFDIDPTDDNKHNINMAVTGLPAGSSLDIFNNNTTYPHGRFVWSMPDLPDRDYTFSVTYTDDGCPVSQHTQVYTIRIKHETIIAEAIAADCSGKGLIKITAPPGWSPWTYAIYHDLVSVYSKKVFGSSTMSDSLVPGKYKVQGLSSLGCFSDVMVEIDFNCDIADIPTGFSPNGDGHNDILYVRGANIREMHLMVYNRWGQLVFQSHDLNTGWDGRYKGVDTPMETYAYALSVIFKSGSVFQKRGNVTLVR